MELLSEKAKRKRENHKIDREKSLYNCKKNKRTYGNQSFLRTISDQDFKKRWMDLFLWFRRKRILENKKHRQLITAGEFFRKTEKNLLKKDCRLRKNLNRDLRNNRHSNCLMTLQ